MTRSIAKIQAAERSQRKVAAEKAATDQAKAVEMTECAERTVAAQEAARKARAEEAVRLAKDYYNYLVGQYGEEVARKAWAGAPLKRPAGQPPPTDARRREIAVFLLMDDTNRELGVTAEHSAELIYRGGFGASADDARRLLDQHRRKRAALRSGVETTATRGAADELFTK